MKAVTLKYTVQTVNEWRAGYSESCKSGSGASVRKPTAAMRQGAGYLAYFKIDRALIVIVAQGVTHMFPNFMGLFPGPTLRRHSKNLSLF